MSTNSNKPVPAVVRFLALIAVLLFVCVTSILDNRNVRRNIRRELHKHGIGMSHTDVMMWIKGLKIDSTPKTTKQELLAKVEDAEYGTSAPTVDNVEYSFSTAPDKRGNHFDVELKTMITGKLTAYIYSLNSSGDTLKNSSFNFNLIDSSGVHTDADGQKWKTKRVGSYSDQAMLFVGTIGDSAVAEIVWANPKNNFAANLPVLKSASNL